MPNWNRLRTGRTSSIRLDKKDKPSIRLPYKHKKLTKDEELRLLIEAQKRDLNLRHRIKYIAFMLLLLLYCLYENKWNVPSSQ